MIRVLIALILLALPLRAEEIVSGVSQTGVAITTSPTQFGILTMIFSG